MSELELVALTRPIEEHGLMEGDVGTIVFVHGGGVAYEVEFMRVSGETVAVLTLEASEVRAVKGSEVAELSVLKGNGSGAPPTIRIAHWAQESVARVDGQV